MVFRFIQPMLACYDIKNSNKKRKLNANQIHNFMKGRKLVIYSGGRSRKWPE